MSKEREPAQVNRHVRDEKGNRTLVVKNAWRLATHHKKGFEVEVDVEHKDDDGNRKTRKETQTRYRWVRREGTTSLKAFARGLVPTKGGVITQELQQLSRAASDWLHNKGANTSKPNQGIGSTRKKKGSGSNK